MFRILIFQYGKGLGIRSQTPIVTPRSIVGTRHFLHGKIDELTQFLKTFVLAKSPSNLIYYAVFWETYICSLLTGSMSQGSKAFSIQIPPLSLSQRFTAESLRNSLNPSERDSGNNSIIGSTADGFQGFHSVGHFVKASKMAAGSRPSGKRKCVINNNTILLDIKTNVKHNVHRVTDIRR